MLSSVYLWSKLAHILDKIFQAHSKITTKSAAHYAQSKLGFALTNTDRCACLYPHVPEDQLKHIKLVE